MPEEEFNTDVEAFDEDVEMDDMPDAEMTGEKEIVEYVKDCFKEGGEAEGLEGDAAIDAVIAKLEGMKTMSTESPLGGLGGGEFPDLDEEELV